MSSGYRLDISEGNPKTDEKGKKIVYAVLAVGAVLAIVGVALIIVGVVRKGEPCEENATVKPTTNVPPTTSSGGISAYSAEAQRVGLGPFLENVKSTYYKMNPNLIVRNPDATPSTIRQEFSPYNCHPSALKKRTDAAKSLYNKGAKMLKDVNRAKLAPRELKALMQAQHFLQSNFGAPYDENYYAGDWLLGPNLFCWQPICGVGSDLSSHFNLKKTGFQPANEGDLEFVIAHLKNLSDSLTQYVENLKYGIKAGYVRSVEECEVGLLTMKRKFKTISKEGERGILNSSYVKQMRNPEWYAKINSDTKTSWNSKHGKDVQQSIDDSLVEYVGQPVYNLLQYLEFNHSQYCVPSNVSSGLANLPLDYVYFKGNKTNETTTKVLPFGEKLSGKDAYKGILPYFTTTDMTPDEVDQLGWKMLNQLYPQAVEIAKTITGLNDSDEAVVEFKKKLEDQSMFFNDKPIPLNESNNEAFEKCVDMASAKIYCPARYASMLKWFEYVNGVLSLLAPLQVRMFYYTGQKQSQPNCPVQLVANFNPGTGSQSYQSSDKACTRPCRYRLPFYLKDHGPRYNAYSVAAHEARPGHHTQVHAFTELFSDDRGDVISWLNGVSYYTAFTEGWALYAENPLINQETNIYDDLPIQRYGMLKWQIWRALRLIIDTGLHYRGMTRDEALELFAKYAWDRTDKAIKDVTRYQSDPGQATAYMIGQLAIWNYRNDTTTKLQQNGKKFNEKDFHFQVLSQGSSPLSYLEAHLQKFTDCTIDPKGSGCDTILNPKFKSRQNAKKTQVNNKARLFTDDEDQDNVDFDGMYESRPRDVRFNYEHYD
ncbi:uncharacterized protein LOC110252020 [Exaiptasia diaphana]|uniref:DUF885 domain-containing protein n=1 Tax=Exaiptasia diaphana TaxID=2652724 RepID=A0A913Y5F9_EXADI|nr:uncharacterized protein LOC110252020 [Exaiptasia diaphana]KXJ22656.1 hypothetical protein AC249_AIPGENE26614 [Exaiptasia diaphana]